MLHTRSWIFWKLFFPRVALLSTTGMTCSLMSNTITSIYFRTWRILSKKRILGNEWKFSCNKYMFWKAACPSWYISLRVTNWLLEHWSYLWEGCQVGQRHLLAASTWTAHLLPLPHPLSHHPWAIFFWGVHTILHDILGFDTITHGQFARLCRKWRGSRQLGRTIPREQL